MMCYKNWIISGNLITPQLVIPTWIIYKKAYLYHRKLWIIFNHSFFKPNHLLAKAMDNGSSTLMYPGWSKSMIIWIVWWMVMIGYGYLCLDTASLMEHTKAFHWWQVPYYTKNNFLQGKFQDVSKVWSLILCLKSAGKLWKNDSSQP